MVNQIYKLSRIKKYIKNQVNFQKKWNKPSNSAVCGDKCLITIRKFHPTISKISYIHEGCILSKSAVNAILLEIENKDKETAKKIVIDFLNMIDGENKEYALGENLLMFQKFNNFPSRKNCLILGARIILDILNNAR